MYTPYDMSVMILLLLILSIMALTVATIVSTLAIFIVGSIIALAIVGIVDLALVAFNGLRSIKSFITSHNMQIKRESIYRKAGSAVPAMDLRIKYRHKSLLMLTINSLAREVDKHNPTLAAGLEPTVQHGTGDTLTGFLKLALVPLAILRAAFFCIKPNEQSALQKSMHGSESIELTIRNDEGYDLKINIGYNADSTPYIQAIRGDGGSVLLQLLECIAIRDYICLVELHYMEGNTAQYSDFINEILRIGAAPDTAVEHRTTVCNSKPADIIEAEQRLLNAISTMVDIHYQGKSLASAVPAESITVNNAEHLPGNTEERSKTP